MECYIHMLKLWHFLGKRCTGGIGAIKIIFIYSFPICVLMLSWALSYVLSIVLQGCYTTFALQNFSQRRSEFSLIRQRQFIYLIQTWTKKLYQEIRKEPYLWYPTFSLNFFLTSDILLQFYRWKLGLSAQTAHLSVLWILVHCQVSTLSQFPIHTLYYAAQDIYMAEAK